MDLNLRGRTTRILRASEKQRTKYLETERTPIVLVPYIGHQYYGMIGMNYARNEFQELETWPEAMDPDVDYFVVQELHVQYAYRGHGAVHILYDAAIKEVHRLGGRLARNWRPDIGLRRNPRATPIVDVAVSIWDKFVAEGRAEILGLTDNPDIPFTVIKRG